MNRRVLNLITVITALALIGVVISQLFWVNNALTLKREQFRQNIDIGLKKVANQLLSIQNDSVMCEKFTSNCIDGVSINDKFIRSLDPQLLDSMFKKTFENLDVVQNYFYAIYRQDNHTFVVGNLQDHHSQILESQHKVAVSCIFQEIQYVLAVYFPLESGFVLNTMQVYILLSIFLLLVIIFGFWYIIYSLIRQKKLSVMKTDFVNNMTHEFKTPISTISIASEMLMNDIVLQNPDRVKKYSQLIYDENDRLKMQVEKVLQVAKLEEGTFKLKLAEIDLHEILKDLAQKMHMTISKRHGKIFLRLNAADRIIFADKTHLTNVFHNLLDNAGKYSNGRPEITVSTRSNKRGVHVSIEDKGIGMAPDQQKLIFKKFHRIPTGDLHDVKGFGIGLFYVETIIEAHGGNIGVKSEIGKGSSFSVFLPFGNNHIPLNVK
nr:HAMP domain-containing histidine kinase [Bacteroidota bacterium]